jgi:hypothetical protein
MRYVQHVVWRKLRIPTKFWLVNVTGRHYLTAVDGRIIVQLIISKQAVSLLRKESSICFS